MSLHNCGRICFPNRPFSQPNCKRNAARPKGHMNLATSVFNLAWY